LRDEGGDDEYYFMNLDDGKYLAVEYDHERIGHLFNGSPLYYESYRDEVDESSLYFKDSSSEATLFRIKEYPFIRDRGFDLEIGSRVNYRVLGCYDYISIGARAIATKYSAFGKEVKLKYGGYCSHYFLDIYRRDGVTDWIPALSPDITRYDPKYEYEQRLLQFEYLWNQREKQREVYVERAQEEAEIGDIRVCDHDCIELKLQDDERYKKRVKSRKMKKSKTKKKRHYRDWNVDDKKSLKCIERKRRKYGRIPKYELCQ